MRKVIQLAANAWASDVTKEDGGASSLLFALCDDGTIWRRDADRGNGPWTPIASPPQALDESTGLR